MFLHRKAHEKAIRYISLDVDNPRLIGYKRRGIFKSQADIIKVLVEHYDVLDVCRSILNNGFHPDEILITIPKTEQGRSSVVVEGNRRLCACKVLLNPDLIKGSSSYVTAKRFQSHKNYDAVKKTIGRLNVVELPGRQEAASYLASKHTQSPIKSWSVYTQGAYYMGLKSSDMTLAQLKSVLNDQVLLTRIKQVVLFYQLSEYILDMECWSPEEQTFLFSNIDQLKTEAIIRLISNSEFKNKVGVVKIDEKGNLVATGFSQCSFDAVIEKLARDAHFNSKEDGSSVISTRQENKGEISQYISDLTEIKAEDEDSDSDSEIILSGAEGMNGDNDENSDEIEEGTVAQGGKKAKRKWTRLITENTVSPTKNPKLADLVDEAKKLNIKQYRYSSVLLARAIIEITLKIVIKHRGLEGELRTQFKERAGDFENVLKFTESKIKFITDDVSVQKAIRSSIKSLLTNDKEIMNLTNHNEIQVLSDIQVNHIKDLAQTFANAFFSELDAGQI